MPITPFTDINRGENDGNVMLSLLGSVETCTATLVLSLLIYSLPTHKYNNIDNQF